MKSAENVSYRDIKNTRFPTSLFVAYLMILLLMSGFHTGLIVLMNELHINKIIQSIIPLIYWGIIAIGITLYTKEKIKKTYEEPMHRLAEATRKVSNGDFSVYVAPTHTTDQLDYLDVMILDFNKMVEELGSIETLKTDFISNVSHEMKTPIAVIKNSAQMLQLQNITDEDRKEYTKTIEHAAGRLSELVTNILKLNRLEHQKIMTNLESYDVCRQICECLIQFEEQWEEKEIEMDLEIEDKAMVKADEQLMELVWNNLLSNAIKFTEAGGKITVCQTSDASGVKVSVKDTGCGMDKQSIAHIFDKFYQEDSSHATEGNGLGLALVHRVIHLMDGEIQVVSEKGKGSTFTVLLPMEE
ncbi:MAG TPA: HAMP domain-containing histidine kinase [Candidatus Pelethocola excrementipullorum]|nr:HAMP domain-containing histidine kinase [Candidatus Pelethocola excrementipullorum]